MQPRNSLLEGIISVAVLIVPIAYVAGFVALSAATQFHGFQFLSPQPVRILAMGGLTVFLAAPLVGAVGLGARLHHWPRFGGFAAAFVGLLGSAASGAVFSGLVVYVLIGWVGVRDMGVLAVYIGFSAVLAMLMWGFAQRIQPSRALPLYVQIGRPSALLFGNALFSITASSLLLGLVLAPAIPQAAGGLSPYDAYLVVEEGLLLISPDGDDSVFIEAGSALLVQVRSIEDGTLAFELPCSPTFTGLYLLQMDRVQSMSPLGSRAKIACDLHQPDVVFKQV